MKKRNSLGWLYDYWPILKKFILRMRLAVILICIIGLTGSYASVYSQQTKLSLNVKNTTVKDVLKMIEEKSEYSFMYNASKINVYREVNLNIENSTIENILKEIFSNEEVSFKIIDRNIIISSNEGNKIIIEQQNKHVSGKITDSSGSPLPGVSVIIKGTSIGTITDGEGIYKLTSVPENATLVFSFVGMKSQEISVSGKNTVDIVMKEDAIGLEEVIAVGYGTMKKSDLTGSISGVSSKDFKLQPMMRATDALQSRLSGVDVQTTSGNPDASIKIRVRGANSINGGNDPLYVCDGVVGAGMPAVEEIESIEVLKDASATAIYGSRGANGVILITTKKGASGQTRISFDMFGSYQKPINLYKKLNAYEYGQEINELYNNVYSTQDLESFKENGGTDWQDEVLRSSWNQNYHISINGGNQSSKYYISGQYKKLNGLIKNTNCESYGLRSNFDLSLFKNLKLEWFINGNYSHYKNTGSSESLGGADAVLFNALTWGPTESIYESNGDYNTADQYGAMGDNPVLVANEMNRWLNNYGISSNSALTWNILPGLSLQYRMNLSYNFNNSYKWESSVFTGGIAGAYGTKSYDKTIFQNAILNWDKSIGNHNLSLTAVAEGYKYTYDDLSGTGTTFANEKLEYWGISTATTKTTDVSWSNNGMLSYVGRFNYNYNNKYYLTGAMRADGSSKFATGNKWGYFPSGSIAWRASEEDFVKSLNFFSDLKVRGSYGVTGNQGVSAYSTIAALNKVGAYYTYASKVNGYTTKAINPNLQWEETNQLDFGIDAGFLKNRLNVTMDYYEKRTKKLLLSVTTPYFLGGDNVYENKGEVSNKGFELSVHAIPIQAKDFYWDFRINFSTNKNKIVNLGGETIYGIGSQGNNDSVLSNETYILQEGLRLGTLYGYKWLGIWQESEATEAAKYGNKPGDNKYADLDNSGSIDASDREPIGHGTPNFTWGFNSTLKYKNWDLNVVVQGVQGCDKLNVMYAMASSLHAKSRTITLQEAWDNSWTSTNKSNKFPSITSTTSTNYINSTHWLQDASYARLKNISIGYTFDKQYTKLGDFRVYVSGQNLLTLTKYKGYDPETTSTTTSDVSTGIDTGVTPTARTFTFGVQLSF
jgi:TonB-dependent starch-binding outer membrane protein SusC